jgi:hypothetical protein
MESGDFGGIPIPRQGHRLKAEPVKLPMRVQVDGVEHRSVSLDGFGAHVAIAGDPDGDPVVLIHGWPLHWWSFATFFARSPRTVGR